MFRMTKLMYFILGTTLMMGYAHAGKMNIVNEGIEPEFQSTPTSREMRWQIRGVNAENSANDIREEIPDQNKSKLNIAIPNGTFTKLTIYNTSIRDNQCKKVGGGENFTVKDGTILNLKISLEPNHIIPTCSFSIVG